MSRLVTVPLGQLDYLGAIVFGHGLGCIFTVGFLSDWDQSAVAQLGWAFLFAGLILRSIDYYRRKKLTKSTPQP